MMGADPAAKAELKLSPVATPVPAAAVPQTKQRGSMGALAFWTAVLLVAIGGIALRVYPSAGFQGVGFDEVLYRVYAQVLEAHGPWQYDEAAQAYLVGQRRPNAKAELPPTRFLYIATGTLWKVIAYGDAPALQLREPNIYHRDPYLRALRNVSAFFSVALMVLSGLMAGRMAGRGTGLAVFALMACAPLQIHLSQHCMVDGFFAFWAMTALWGMWESLRRPDRPWWVAVYGVGLVAMVLTKENSFFVYCALCGTLVANRWAKWGTVSRPLLVATVAAPALALAILVSLAGGIPNFIEIYRLLVTNAQHLDYAIETGDGPWYRYLVDLIVVSPVILCLAVATALRSGRQEKWVPYLLTFVGLTYFIMCNVRYGMNLRYTSIWDLPLCLFAFAQLAWMARGAGRWSKYLLPALVGLLCLHELQQYRTFFVRAAVYELGPPDLLHAIKILK